MGIQTAYHFGNKVATIRQGRVKTNSFGRRDV